MTNSPGWSSQLFNTYHRLDKQDSSYPSSDHFQQPISAFERFSALRDSDKAQRSLALSVNIPFCANACYYCTAKNIVTKDRSRSSAYLQSLEQEIRLVAQQINTHQQIKQLHFGGGPPTYLNPAALRQLMDCLKDNFNIVSDNFSQYSIDIDPRETDWSTMGMLRDIGFNRVNIEAVGLDPTVQRAINRLQSIEQTQTLVEAARTLQFRTVNISLMYGLPKQTPQAFAQTLADILNLGADRIIVQGFQHQPNKHPIQKRINAQDLTCSAAIEQMLHNAQQQLSDAGYHYIGIGHFALADDEFAFVQEQDVLQYNLQDHGAFPNCDIIGFGLSAISHLGHLYYQNTHDVNAYKMACNNQQLPAAQGLFCKSDDHIRRSIIQALTCQFRVDFARIEQRHKINLKEYLREQWPLLEHMQHDGLLTLTEHSLQMTPSGRLFTLAVCQLFDQYCAHDKAAEYAITHAI